MKDGKDVKEFHLDPLIKYFDNIVKRCQLVNPFHTKVLPRKQVKHIEKKDMDRKAKNILFEAVSNRNYTLVKELILKGADL